MFEQEYQVLIEVLSLSPQSADMLQHYFTKDSKPGESLSVFLERQQILGKVAARSLTLAARGYVSTQDLAALLDSAETNRALLELLTSATSTASLTLVETGALAFDADSLEKQEPTPNTVAAVPQELGPFSSTTIPRILRPGTRLGKFMVENQLGGGGFGMVYRAFHTSLKIAVAIKLLNLAPKGLHNSFELKNFRKEAMLLAQVNHPHVVRVWDFDEDHDPPYLAMELVDGPTLATVIQRAGRMQPRAAIETVWQIVLGLEACCKLGIVHHDIKPSNILFTQEGTVKVADFGLARFCHAYQEDSSYKNIGIAGTAEYMAPEQASGE